MRRDELLVGLQVLQGEALDAPRVLPGEAQGALRVSLQALPREVQGERQAVIRALPRVSLRVVILASQRDVPQAATRF